MLSIVGQCGKMTNFLADGIVFFYLTDKREQMSNIKSENVNKIYKDISNRIDNIYDRISTGKFGMPDITYKNGEQLVSEQIIKPYTLILQAYDIIVKYKIDGDTRDLFYYVDLTTIKTHQDVIGWAMHLMEQTWTTKEMIYDICELISEVKNIDIRL